MVIFDHSPVGDAGVAQVAVARVVLASVGRDGVIQRPVAREITRQERPGSLHLFFQGQVIQVARLALDHADMVELVGDPVGGGVAQIAFTGEVVRIGIGEVEVIGIVAGSSQAEDRFALSLVVVAVAAHGGRVGINPVDVAGFTFQLAVGFLQFEGFMLNLLAQKRHRHGGDFGTAVEVPVTGRTSVCL